MPEIFYADAARLKALEEAQGIDRKWKWEWLEKEVQLQDDGDNGRKYAYKHIWKLGEF